MKVKIISNPYIKKTEYQKYDKTSGQWIAINYGNGSDDSSRLLSDTYTTGFFPFQAKKIIDIIAEDFENDSEQIEVIFEGTDDEYKELESVFSACEYNPPIALSRSDMRYLPNARDILPQVKDIFARIERIISDCVDEEKISRERKQFADVSKEAIPICVLGNYSSGKSTFINALIGYEILPSGDESLTARIHRIERSAYDDRATIQFEYDKLPVAIRFREDSYAIETELNEHEFITQISKALQENADEPLTVRVNKALEVINYYDRDANGGNISDMIELVVPFRKEGIFGNSQNKFVLFDTPGSNSASNDRHMEILKKALQDLSNGLPLYVSEFSSLDSTDNEKLCQEIIGMPELDSRFTMIIVNKADASNIEKKKITEDSILSQALPKALYAGGLYFVSSIMGLGAKNDGELIDEHYDETFETLRSKYEDPNSKYYKTLYRFNIMPEQIKAQSICESESCPNLILANSGLFWIEHEIDSFASKYSAYNKCQQSVLFLARMIEITSAEIADKKISCEGKKQVLSEKLENDKKLLLNTLQESKDNMQTEFVSHYPEDMQATLDAVTVGITKAQLSEEEEAITQAKKNDASFDDHNIGVEAAQKAFGDELRKFKEVRNLSALKERAVSSWSKRKELASAKRDMKSAAHDIDSAAATELLERVKNACGKSIESAQVVLTENSMQYWMQRSDVTRKRLVGVVTGSEALSEQKRKELADIIMTYAPIEFTSQVDDVFIKEKFEHLSISFFGIHLFENNRLNLGKLAKTYNSVLKQSANNVFEWLKTNHGASYIEWLESLLQRLRERITDFNPSLQALSKMIAEEEQNLKNLIDKQEKMTQYTHQIEELMTWTELMS